MPFNSLEIGELGSFLTYFAEEYAAVVE